MAADQEHAPYLAAQFITHDNALDAVNLLPVLKKDQGGDTIDVVLPGEIFVAIHISPRKSHAVLIFLANGAEFWFKDLAGPAPVRSKVDHHHLRGRHHLFREILAAYRTGPGGRICDSLL